MSVQWPLLAMQTQTMRTQLGPRSDKEKYIWEMWHRQINQDGKTVLTLPRYRFQDLKLRIMHASVSRCENIWRILWIQGQIETNGNPYLGFLRSYYPMRQGKASLIDTCIQAHTKNRHTHAVFISGMFCRLPLEKQNPTGRPEEQ